jgi:TRAP-type C4-dicarboxylate transport system substrate-binding protein
LDSGATDGRISQTAIQETAWLDAVGGGRSNETRFHVRQALASIAMSADRMSAIRNLKRGNSRMSRNFETSRSGKPGSALVLALATTFVAAAAMIGSAAAQQPFVLKFGNQTQNDVQHDFMKRYKDELEKVSGGKIRVELYPASQLGPFPRQVEGLRLGNIQALTGPLEFFVGVDPSFQATSMAGLFKDNEHIRAVADKPEFRKIIEDVGDKKGVTVGAFIVYDMQYFTFKQPAVSLADVKGRRVRVLASEAEQASVQSLGMASIPMALPEVLPALQQGTIDGVSSGLSIFTTLRYYDAAPNALETRLWGILTGVLFSKEWLSGLPADLRKQVLDVAKSLEAPNHAWNVENLQNAREVWTKNGGKLLKLPDAEQAAAQKSVSEATVKVLSKYPAVKATYDAIKAIADKTP